MVFLFFEDFAQNSQVVSFGICLPTTYGSFSLSVLAHLVFSNDFSRTLQSFSAPRLSFRTFLLKDFVFLVAAYLKNVLSQILQVFLLFLLRCFVNVGSDLSTFLQSVLRTLVYSF